jgi:hypothetical protein
MVPYFERDCGEGKLQSSTEHLLPPSSIVFEIMTGQRVVYGSDPGTMMARKNALCQYFCMEPQDLARNINNIWGRTILSELVFEHMMQEIFGQILSMQNISIAPAPTSIDSSADHYYPYSKDGSLLILREQDVKTYLAGKAAYNQKGADFVVVENLSNTPLCGIDVTMGNGVVLKKKRTGRPPLNPHLGMPVIVLGMKNFQVDSMSFALYLDTSVRPHLLRGGKIPKTPLDHKLITQVGEVFNEGVVACSNSIHNSPYIPSWLKRVALQKLRHINNVFAL